MKVIWRARRWAGGGAGVKPGLKSSACCTEDDNNRKDGAERVGAAEALRSGSGEQIDSGPLWNTDRPAEDAAGGHSGKRSIKDR